jgi:putative spermidine/putrescine transport system permease protein
VILLSLLFIIGIINGLAQSFGLIPSLGLYRPTLFYYREVFSRPDLLSSIVLSLYISAVSSLFAAVFGVLLSALLVAAGHARGKVMQIAKIPIAIPHTVVALFVINIFSQSGLAARILYFAGLIQAQNSFPPMLFSANSIGIILAYLWKEIPFVAFFVISVMANISSTLVKPPKIWGITRGKTFRYVTLPLTWPAVRNAFLIIFAFSLGAYELPFLLGATAPKALPVQAFVEYTHPDLLHRPYAMALNGVMFFISLIAAFLYYHLLHRNIRKANG